MTEIFFQNSGVEFLYSQALVAPDPPVLVVVDPVLSLLVGFALGPGLELFHRRTFANSTQVLVPPPRFRNTAGRRLKIKIKLKFIHIFPKDHVAANENAHNF